MEYFVIWSLIALMSIYEYNFLRRKNPVIYSFIVILLILFSGLRYQIGTDYGIYSHVYELSKQAPELAILDTEFLYVFLSYISPNLTYVLVVYSLLSVTLIAFVIYKSDRPFLSLLLFYSFAFIFYDMGIIRQGLAISLCVFSIKLIFDNKLKNFLFVIIVTCLLVHRTSIFFLPMYWLSKVNFTRKKFYLILLTSVVLSLLFKVSMITGFLSFLPSYFAKSVSTISSDEYTYVNSWGVSEFRKLIMCIFLFEVLNKRVNSKEQIYLNIYYLGVFLSLILISHLTMRSRGTYYFCVAEIFLLPLCLSFIKKSLIKSFYFVFILVYCFMYLQQVIETKQSYEWQNLPYLPYNSIIYQ